MGVQISRLSTASEDFSVSLDRLLAWDSVQNQEVNARVDAIIADVRARGDAALLEYTERFDQRELNGPSALVIEAAQIEAARTRIAKPLLAALEQASERIQRYHQRQVQASWQYVDDDGTVLGQKITPLDRVGLYAPGGKAAYPSSVLMSAIPAKVAGVREVVLVSPAPKGVVNDVVLAAASVAGIDRIITVGGAQAIAALAYGTGTVPKVDKIVGPGNIYVATAKRAVFGAVNIDMIAGPSEILVIADDSANPDWVAMDLFSQAEHDEQAQSILLSPSRAFISRVENSVERLLPTMPRKEVIARSLKTRGALIEVRDLEEAVQVSNRIAPEHLELAVENPAAYVDSIRHAGAIFMGHYTSESLGDYCAGPSHVLPTSGTARFSSPLGVYDFIKRSSIIDVSADAAQTLGPLAACVAESEGLDAHAQAALMRCREESK